MDCGGRTRLWASMSLSFTNLYQGARKPPLHVAPWLLLPSSTEIHRAESAKSSCILRMQPAASKFYSRALAVYEPTSPSQADLYRLLGLSQEALQQPLFSGLRTHTPTYMFSEDMYLCRFTERCCHTTWKQNSVLPQHRAGTRTASTASSKSFSPRLTVERRRHGQVDIQSKGMKFLAL